jgi:hypothetical protein
MYPPKRNILDVLFGRAQDSMVESRWQKLLKDWPPEVWAKGGLLRIMPYMVSTR